MGADGNQTSTTEDKGKGIERANSFVASNHANTEDVRDEPPPSKATAPAMSASKEGPTSNVTRNLERETRLEARPGAADNAQPEIRDDPDDQGPRPGRSRRIVRKVKGWSRAFMK